MRIPASAKGAIFAPVLICLLFVLKAFCPESAGSNCFADQFAVPIFLPLVAIYKIFGGASIVNGYEFALITIYWAFIGFLVGLVVDLLRHSKSASLTVSNVPEPKPSAPVFIAPANPPVQKESIPINSIAHQDPVISKSKLPINILERKKEDWPTTPY